MQPDTNSSQVGQPKFFDRYQRFFLSSKSGGAYRLRYRYQILFEGREATFAGNRVIDIGSHDGRWSFCALKAGAKYVLGIEAREDTAAGGSLNFEYYGVPRESYDFRICDAYDVLGQLDERDPRYRFDVGLCVGFLYHTSRHFELIAHLSRLGCRTLIVETNVIQDESQPIVRYRMEPVNLAHNAYSSQGVIDGKTISALPSVSAMIMLLSCFGYVSEILLGPPPKPIPDVLDFTERRRVAILGKRSAA